MIELNLLKFGFAALAFFMVFVGALINTMERHLPLFIVQTFRYGKFSYVGKESFIKPIEVPKRWFRHFYIFAAFFSSLATVIVCNVYYFGGKIDPWLLRTLDLLAPGRKASVGSMNVFIAINLLTIQSWHRLYETCFISVFSDAKMNLAHYLVGFIHYFGSIVAILSEAPGFISIEEPVLQIKISDLKFIHVINCSLFLWSCYQQYKSNIILANLRKNHKGQVITMKHTIPYGGMFDYVSSPHLLAEVVMYFSLTCLLWGASTWPWVFLWVLSNQVESSMLSHWWYKSTFATYPSERKAIFPFIL